ncbi:hypothetical protein EBQ91_05855 [bacterium]|nr:hypothetical protein [bacterium]
MVKNKRNLILHYFFMSLGCLLTGCFNHEHELNQQPLEPQSIVQHGHITFDAQKQVNKFRFKYQQYTPNHYTMCIYPLLSKPIVLVYQDEAVSLDLQGCLYEGEAAYDYLHKLAPNFPWHQLPSIVQHGNLYSSEWSMQQWDNKGFLIAGHDSSLQWAIKK